mgnify:FL=1|jgi:hypothetical protein
MKAITNILTDIFLIITILVCGLPTLVLAIVFYYLIIKDIDWNKEIQTRQGRCNARL